MSDATFYILTALGAAVTAVVLTPVLILVAQHLGLMDQPDARKVHDKPIPRAGGVAIAAGTLLAGVVALIVAQARGVAIPAEMLRQLATVAGAAFFVFLVGLVDDVRGVTPRYKALALVAAALAVCGSGVVVDTIYLGGKPVLSLGVASWPMTMLWIVGMAIAINFIDGLDGLAAGLVLLATAVLAAFAILAGSAATAIIPLALGGALVGFLVFNTHPARIFMGDAGSLFLGFVIASVMVLANPVLGTMKGLVLPGLALSIPIVDTALTLYRRRYEQRRSIFAAECGHIHHTLLDQGLTHRQAVLMLYGVSVLAVGVGLLALAAESWRTFATLSLAVPLLWGAFRFAGSVRTHEMLAAIRRKRHLDRVAKQYVDAFHGLQMEFRTAATFSQWWQCVCNAAERFEFAAVSLPLTGRDGDTMTLAWSPTEPVDPQVERLTATVPVAERRRSEPLRAHVEVVATRSVESAGQRLAFFTRLMSDHSVAHLATNPRGRFRDASSDAHDAGNSNHPGEGPDQPDHTDAASAPHNGLTHIAGWEKIAPPPPLPRKGRHPDHDGRLTDGPLAGARMAIVHDFLYVYAGAEKVLEQMIDLYPQADLFALFDFVPDDQRAFLRGKAVKTTFIQKLPFARQKHRAYLPMMPLAIEQLDLADYDIVLTSSYLAAKGIITGPAQLHICYCHSPVRYAWDLQHQYLDQRRIGFGAKGMLARAILHYIRNWDARSALGVDLFVANSRFVAQRIHKLYRRDARVIHPPVDVQFFTPPSPQETADAGQALPDNLAPGGYYLAASRLVPYKRIDLVVEAFNRMPDRRLVVVGTGPESARIAAIAGPNVTLVGYQSDDMLRHYLRHAKALVFAAEEDFGIVPVEAMACGTPVIAYGRGGVRETVVDGQTGLFFHEQNAEAIADAVSRFEHAERTGRSTVTTADAPERHARRAAGFSVAHFRDALSQLVQHAWEEHRAQRIDQPTPDAPPHHDATTAAEPATATPTIVITTPPAPSQAPDPKAPANPTDSSEPTATS